MPTVRRFTERQVGRAPLPGARRTAAETFASQGGELALARAGTTDALGRLGAQGTALVADLIRSQRLAAENTAITEAQNELLEWKQRRLYDPEQGAFTRTGKNAQGLPEEVLGEYEQIAGQIEARLSTDRERALFARVRGNQRLAIDLDLRRHVFTESQRYQAAEGDRFVENIVQEGILSFRDPAAIGRALDAGRAKIVELGEQFGMGAEEVEARTRSMESAVHEGVIARLLANEADEQARVYLDAVKDSGQVRGEALDDLEEAVAVGNVRRRSQQEADRIMAAHESEREALVAARAITDPEVRDATVDRVRQRFTERDQQQTAARRENMVRYGNLIDTRRSVDAIPPAEWQALLPEEKAALERYAEAVRSPEAIDTDWATYTRRMREAADNPRAFARRDLMLDRYRLSDGEYRQLVGIQAAILGESREAAETALNDLDSWRSDEDLFNSTLGEAGIERDDTEAFQINRAMRQEFELFQRREGRAPTDIEKQSILDGIMRNVLIEQGSILNIFPGGKPLFDVTRPVYEILVEIPLTDRAEIEDALRRRGMPVTTESVVGLWMRAQREAER